MEIHASWLFAVFLFLVGLVIGHAAGLTITQPTHAELKPACLGIAVPTTWSVYSHPFATRNPDQGAGPRGVYCALSPSKITFGDGSFDQIDIAVMDVPLNLAVDNQRSINTTADTNTEYAVAGYRAIRLDELVDPAGPTKEHPGGAVVLIEVAPTTTVRIHKWAKLNVDGEALFDRILDQLDLRELAPTQDGSNRR